MQVGFVVPGGTAVAQRDPLLDLLATLRHQRRVPPCSPTPSTATAAVSRPPCLPTARQPRSPRSWPSGG